MTRGCRSVAATLAAVAGFASAAACAAPLGPPAATMEAVRLIDYGGVENLRLERLPTPVPRATEVLVRVRAASVNPYDWKFRDGRLRAYFRPALPLTPGIDFAGVVAVAGPRAGGWKPGEAVYGFVADGDAGTYARYVIAQPANLARKPRGMSFEEAAGLPVVALTAWKALFDVGRLGAGERVLLNGASGGVGLAAIQLAKIRGATVVAVASAANAALMRSYGADVTLDYRTQRVADSVRPAVDLAVDGVDAGTAAQSLLTVRPGGRLVSLNVNPATALDCAPKQVECVQVENFRPSGDAFARVAALARSGRLRMTVGRRFPLAEAAAAQEASRAGGTPGKIVLTLD